MTCPACAHAAIVLETRAKEEHVYRRRLCTGCGQRFTTAQFFNRAEYLVVPDKGRPRTKGKTVMKGETP